jgi:hypothetical protein
MDIQMKVKILVQQVVEAYLKENVPDNKLQPITILLSYQTLNPGEVLQAVTKLLATYEVTLILSKDWLPLVDQLSVRSYLLLEEIGQKEVTAIIEYSSVLVVPVATHGLLAKLALTMDDELAVWVALQYQLLGHPIVIANNDIEPNVYQQILAPPSVQERLQTYISRIQADQVKWVPLSKLVKTVADQSVSYHEKQVLILAKHVEKAFHDGLNEIIVPTKSRITPSAKDLARELKIHINKTNSLKGGSL